MKANLVSLYFSRYCKLVFPG